MTEQLTLAETRKEKRILDEMLAKDAENGNQTINDDLAAKALGILTGDNILVAEERNIESAKKTLMRFSEQEARLNEGNNHQVTRNDHRISE